MSSIESGPQSLANQLTAVAIAADYPEAGQRAAQMAGVSVERMTLEQYCAKHDLDVNKIRDNLDKTG